MMRVATWPRTWSSTRASPPAFACTATAIAWISTMTAASASGGPMPFPSTGARAIRRSYRSRASPASGSSSYSHAIFSGGLAIAPQMARLTRRISELEAVLAMPANI
jgi:hypothetical protein